MAGRRRAGAATTVTVLAALAGLTLAACGPASGTGYHPPRNSDPRALESKLTALMADECYTGNPRVVYPACGKYFTQLVGTVGAIDDVLTGKPADLHAAANAIHGGMNDYASHACAPADQHARPELTEPCAAALRTVNTNLRRIDDGLYPPGTP